MALKRTTADLTKGEKIDGVTFNIWHQKIQYVLNEQEIFETLTNILEKPPSGNIDQHRLGLIKTRSKNHCAMVLRYILCKMILVARSRFIISQRKCRIHSNLFVGTSSSSLYQLYMCFDSCKMGSKHPMIGEMDRGEFPKLRLVTSGQKVSMISQNRNRKTTTTKGGEKEKSRHNYNVDHNIEMSG